MAATLCHPQLPNLYRNENRLFNVCEPQPKGDLQHTPRKELDHVVHGVFRVVSHPESPQEKHNIPVKVIDGFTGKMFELVMKRNDTIGKLKEAFLSEMPQLQGTLNLALNGKPVHSEMTMCKLNVKPGAVFVTFHRCPGG